MSKENITNLACELAAACAKYTPTSGLEPSPERDEILKKARQISLAVSSPLHYTWTQIINMYALASLRTLMHLGVLHRIPSTGAIELEQLAKQTGIQTSLLKRLLRVMVATQFIDCDRDGQYSHTRISRAYAAVLGPGMMFQITYDDCLPGIGRLHHYFKERKSYAEPDDQSYNPFTWSKGQDGRTVWDIMSETGGMDIFQTALATMDKKFPPTGFFDFAKLATDGSRDILVEVGGGIGKTLASIIDSSPELQKMPSKFVLQDLEAPIQQARKRAILPAGVRMMTNDMFTGQPIKGAKSYYLRRVLHDYSDSKCVEILKHIVSAAASDSVILISEMMVPAECGEGELSILCMDMSMMNMGGKERTEVQWRHLLSEAGLELTKIWEGFGTDRLLEARLTGKAGQPNDTEITI